MPRQTVGNNNAMPSRNYSRQKKIREGEREKKRLLNKGSHEESNPVHQIENHGS